MKAALLYFDLFEYPLSEQELLYFFPVPTTATDIHANLSSEKIKSKNGFYHIRTDDSIVDLRKRRERAAKFMLFISRLIGSFIGRFPFVRAVFLSGSLSKGVNNGRADVDLFVITEGDRLWICRAIITSFKKIFLLNRKRFLCPNYLLTEKHLEIPEKNIFTATELITLKPLYLSDNSIPKRLYDSNGWITRFYPNCNQLINRRVNHDLESCDESAQLSRDGYLSKIDFCLMEYFRKTWRKRYREFSDTQLDFLFRTTPDASKVHPNDFQTKILNEYELRLRKENLQRLTRLDG